MVRVQVSAGGVYLYDNLEALEVRGSPVGRRGLGGGDEREKKGSGVSSFACRLVNQIGRWE